jgi:hypothetical protein
MSMTEVVPADLAYLQWLKDECGYLGVKPLPGGRWAAIWPKAFTHAIITGAIGDAAGYADSWCYETLVQAWLALGRWDGPGEPEGWIRHPDTGRRVSRDPDERDEDGNRVGAVGVLYQRW